MAGPRARIASPAVPHAVGAQDVLVDRSWYSRAAPGGRGIERGHKRQLHRVGWKLGYNPDQSFDTTYYLKTNADVAAASVNP